MSYAYVESYPRYFNLLKDKEQSKNDMAVPEVISDQPSLIPQKRSASIPDSAPIPKKHNNTTRTIKNSSDKKRDDSHEPKDSKSTKNSTEGEVFRRLEGVRTEMATISWYMDLPEALNIPEILC